jgi:hypothetical protein
MKKQLVYTMTDHACMKCGGRVLASNSSTGIGGYVSYICSCCEASGSGMLPPICYYHLKWRGGEVPLYRCVHRRELSESPWMKDACAHSGYDIESGQVIGMVSIEAERDSRIRYEEN